MQKFLIAPSILAADLAKLGQEVDSVLEAGADIIHFDVMDNHYVPNLSFGPMICKALRDYGITAKLDVHLMVEPVDSMIESFAEAGANMISFHPEASRHVERSIQLIADLGCKPGLVLNPASSLTHLDHVMHKLHHILLMSVNPGYGGQQFIPHSLTKLKQIKQLIIQSGHDIRLEIDGGVKVDNIRSIAEAGADMFVAGSAIFSQLDYQQVINAMRHELSLAAPNYC